MGRPPPRDHARPHSGHHRSRHLAYRGQGHRGVPVPVRAGILATGNSFLTPDGTRIVTATSFYSRQRTPGGGYVQITEYSARTGKPLFHEDRFSASIGWQEVLWASPDGSALVISDPRGTKTRYGNRNNILGVLAGNKFTPIPHNYTGLFLAW